MALHVGREDVEFFRQELWKDERQFPVTAFGSADGFVKQCFGEVAAQREARVLELLSAVPGEALAPKIKSQDAQILVMEKISGIRLFDLLRYLRRLELERRDGAAETVRVLLLRRCRQRLARIQQVLLDNAADMASSAYPLDEKLIGLLQLFVRVLAIGHAPRGWEEDASTLGAYWMNEGALIPFRDATSKNIMVAEPTLSVELAVDPDERLASISRLLNSRSIEYWQTVPIFDIDFSSVEHLTTPEDDPISLHCHEWTYGSCPTAPESFVLLPQRYVPDSYRTAATFVVRYMRFGGRKLAYKLLNAQGFEVRFEYDDPLFYFKNLPGIVRQLDQAFAAEYRALLDLVALIGFTISNLSASEEAQLRVDHFRRIYGEKGNYWQENPIERKWLP